MYKRLAALLVVAFGGVALDATQAIAQVIPPSGLAPGSQYQVLFVTQGTRDAQSSNIDDYNAFVSAQAALNPSLPSGITWHAVGSTSSIAAQVNAPSGGLPVYDTHGILLIPAGAGLYAADMPSTTILDQFGAEHWDYVWTGTQTPPFVGATMGYLGDSQGVEIGFSGYCCNFSTGWISQHSRQNPDVQLSLYALSDPITVAFGLPQVSSGLRHTCALQGDGTLSCWGDNTYGQATPPAGVFTQVSAGGSHTCAVQNDGTMACWGDNTSGQLGSAGGFGSLRFGQISAGNGRACGVKSGGGLVCWGSASAVPAPGIFAQISAGGAHICAVQTDRALACWGDNTFGQAAPPAGTFAQVSAGDTHTCGAQTDGSLACWGDNSYGQASLDPHTRDGILAAVEDTAAVGTLVGTAPTGTPLTFSIVSNGLHGTAAVTNASTGAFTYTPAPDANGIDSFTFKASNGATDSNVGTITVSIAPVDDAPVATGAALTTAADTQAAGTLTATDIDGPALTFTIVTNGTKGTATITNPATGAFSYVPNGNASGADSFTFKVNDGSLDSNVATVAVTITPVPASVSITANGAEGPVILPHDSPLQIAIAAHTATGAATISPADMYIGLQTPFGLFWLNSSLGFVTTPSRLLSAPLPTFGPVTLFTFPNASVLPAGTYTWIIAVVNGGNLLFDYVQTTVQ